MRIAIDAMGGDNAPKAIIEGALQAIQEYEVEVFLIGKKDEINKYIENKFINSSHLNIIDASETILNDDSPVTAIRQKKDSSMVIGLKLVKEGQCDAFVSAGSTGAFLAGSLLKVGRIKGIDRPALSPIMPTIEGCCMIIDAGANADCKPKNLEQFAIMGSIYMQKVNEIAKPRVGILNIGTEEGKGNELTKQSYELLRNLNINFIGNVEARDILNGVCDVCVCDGFAGNILLKSTEGAASTIFKLLKQEFTKNTKNKIGALILKDSIKGFKKKFDYTEYGGAPFLGIDGIMIKAHGSSDANAFKNAIRQAKILFDYSCIKMIKEQIASTGVDVVE